MQTLQDQRKGEKMIRDTWRAVLVVAVVFVLREMFSVPPPQPPPPVYGNGQMMYYYPPVQGNEQPRPLRRIGGAVVELGDSLLGALRR